MRGTSLNSLTCCPLYSIGGLLLRPVILRALPYGHGAPKLKTVEERKQETEDRRLGNGEAGKGRKKNTGKEKLTNEREPGLDLWY
jgi:hypothetical protein